MRRALGSALVAALLPAAMLVLLGAPAPVRAQSATISMSVDRTSVQVGENVRLQIRVDVSGAQAPDPELPDLGAFDVVSRQMSRPMSLSFGFGSQPTVTQATVIYVFLLRARDPGRHRLEPPRVRIGRQVFEGNEVTIDVRGTAPPSQQPAPQQQPGQPQPAQQPGQQVPPGAQTPEGGFDGMIYDDQAFLRTVVDDRTPYLGQQVTVTIYLYVRSGLRDAPAPVREPTTDGFWVHDLLPPQRALEASTQVWGSTPFRVYVLRRFAAFPLRAGELTITPMTVRVPIGTVWDLFGGGGPPPDLERMGVPITLSVRDLPQEGRPPGEVHVGGLALEASIDRSQVPTGDAVTLTVRASGTGMVQGVRVPDPRVDGLRVLSPQARDEVSSPGDLVSGIRTLEWLIVPEREGSYTIPAFRVPTFDPATGQYTVVESQAVALTAAGNPVAAVDPGTIGAELAHDDQVEQGQFGPVRQQSAFARRSERIAAAPWYPFALALPPLAWLALVITTAVRRRAAARAEGDVAGRASKEARRRLASAEAARTAGDARAFYAAVSLALKSVIEGRLGESVGSLTHPQLKKKLAERGMVDDLARAVVDELEAIEFARFSATGAESSEMDAQLARARELIGKLDRFVATPVEEA